MTWTCRRCGAVLLSEAEYAMHVMMCGPNVARPSVVALFKERKTH